MMYAPNTISRKMATEKLTSDISITELILDVGIGSTSDGDGGRVVRGINSGRSSLLQRSLSEQHIIFFP